MPASVLAVQAVQAVQAKPLYDDASTVSTVDLKEPRTAKRERPVRFCPRHSNQVFPYVHINDMGPQDIHNAWYTVCEFDRIKRDIIGMTKKLRRGMSVEENNHQTVRGLEYRTRAGSQRRKQSKLIAWDIVMGEQRRQLIEGEYDEERLAEAYHRVCSHCREAAVALGGSDEMEIERDLEKIRWEYSRSSPETEDADMRRLSGFMDKLRVMKSQAQAQAA
jgi:hypothetical protein